MRLAALSTPGVLLRAGVTLAGVILASVAMAEVTPEGAGPEGIGIDGMGLEGPAGDRAAGQQLAGQCRTCHGLDGLARIPIAPHIGGEPEGYLRAQLAAFRDGTRTHEMMSIVARGLSDQQIADLAAWYAGHDVSVSMTQDPADAPGLCAGCHGDDGIHLVPDVPNLAGEANIYIDTQLKAFRSGKRVHEVMTPIAADLTDQEIRAFADWYGAVTIEIETIAPQ